MKKLSNLLNAKIFISIQLFTVVNSIAAAVSYMNEPAELEAALAQQSRVADLINKGTIEIVGPKTVKYQVITFDSLTAGSYAAATGYTEKGTTTEWKTVTLTQDKGNSLFLDRVDSEEAMGLSIVQTFNRYTDKVKVPTIDTYAFATFAAKPGVFVNGGPALTKTTILEAITEAFATLENANIDTSSLILYMSPTARNLLTVATYGMGKITQGAWNGELNAQVDMIDGAKIVSVPSARLGAGIDFILLHPNAVDVIIDHDESTFFNEIPGHGKRKSQVDVGYFYDAFVHDTLVTGVYVYAATDTFTVTFNKNSATATGTTAAKTIAYATATALTTNGFSDAGKTFAGWALTADGEVLYDDAEAVTISNRLASDAITLYAIWE